MRIWSSYNCDGLFWFRIFGYGIKGKDITKHPLLFSERQLGHGLQIGKWRFGWLKKDGQ